MPLPNHIVITQNLGEGIRQILGRQSFSKVIVLTDENTRLHCYPIVRPSLPDHLVISIVPGEENKNLNTCTRVWKQLTDHHIDRQGLLVILGGGVAGDLGGFCAATYKRGINFILIPTTLLAMVDASIGGKMGIDFENFKNHIGVFSTPMATLIFTPFLKTLPPRELRSGFAEVIKHCLLSDEESWLDLKKKAITDIDWNKMVGHSVEFKNSIASNDPLETGLRKILNYGHTVGHALESYSMQNGDRILHGEAIAAGMIIEADIAKQKRLLKEPDFKAIRDYILSVFGRVSIPENANLLLDLMVQDKKSKGNKILIAVPKGIGHYTWDVEVTSGEVLNALADYSRGQT